MLVTLMFVVGIMSVVVSLLHMRGVLTMRERRRVQRDRA
jgi:hypothetical protein